MRRYGKKTVEIRFSIFGLYCCFDSLGYGAFRTMVRRLEESAMIVHFHC